MSFMFSVVVKMALDLQADLIPSLCTNAHMGPTSWHPLSHSLYFNGGHPVFWSPSEVFPSTAALLGFPTQAAFPLV